MQLESASSLIREECRKTGQFIGTIDEVTKVSATTFSFLAVPYSEDCAKRGKCRRYRYYATILTNGQVDIFGGKE